MTGLLDMRKSWKLFAEKIEEASLLFEFLIKYEHQHSSKCLESIWRDQTLVYIQLSPMIKVSCSWPDPNPLGVFQNSRIETVIIRNDEIDNSELYSHNDYTQLLVYIQDLYWKVKQPSRVWPRSDIHHDHGRDLSHLPVG